MHEEREDGEPRVVGVLEEERADGQADHMMQAVAVSTLAPLSPIHQVQQQVH